MQKKRVPFTDAGNEVTVTKGVSGGGEGWGNKLGVWS